MHSLSLSLFLLRSALRPLASAPGNYPIHRSNQNLSSTLTRTHDLSCTQVCPDMPFAAWSSHQNERPPDLDSLPEPAWQNDRLNAEQKRAVRMILGGLHTPLPYFVFGPPGTGKTTAMVEAAYQVSEES